MKATFQPRSVGPLGERTGRDRLALPLVVALLLGGVLATFASEPLDKIVASVDHHPIMRSEVEEEARFAHFISGQPGQVTLADEVTALNRLIDRALIDDQIAVFGDIPVETKEVQSRIADIRAAVAGADTEENWRGVLAHHQLDQEIVSQHVEEELRTLRFIDMRFRSEVRVGPRSIQTYYDSTFVPEMRKQNLAPPPLPEVQSKIEAILREQRIDNLISDWLKNLRTQSRIQTFDPNLPLHLDRKAEDLSNLRFLPLRTTADSEAAKQ
jgi:SurA N-terminal domain